MSQVKNLRAMFENKEDTSPPDRGRSSGTSTPYQPGPHGTGSPRPLSKVRTSFVAIEKDGRMGLRRDPSGDSTVSRRRMSNDTDTESTAALPDKLSAASADEASKPARQLFVNEPIPESPRHLPEVEVSSSDVAATVVPPATGVGQPSIDNTPAVPSKPSTPTEPTQPVPPTVAVVDEPPVNKENEIIKTEPSKASSARQKHVTRPATLNTKSRPSNESAKSPNTAKPAAAAPHRTDLKSAVKAVAKSSAKQEISRDTSLNSKSSGPKTTKPPASAGAKKPQILKTKASHDAGFVKPKVKSPTKPVSLPSSLTAPTASSVSKGTAPRQSLSRQSGSLQPPASTRSPSRTSTSTTSAPTKTVKRQPSTIGRPRPSIGPPPKKTAASEPSAKKPGSQVDEGFLARMMRPTQSSSSKVAEKAPVTPPRKAGTRQSASGTESTSKHESVSKRGDKESSASTKQSETNGLHETASAAAQPTARSDTPTSRGSTQKNESCQTLPLDAKVESEIPEAPHETATPTASHKMIQQEIQISQSTDAVATSVEDHSTKQEPELTEPEVSVMGIVATRSDEDETATPNLDEENELNTTSEAVDAEPLATVNQTKRSGDVSQTVADTLGQPVQMKPLDVSEEQTEPLSTTLL